ncbi:leucine-rich repeat domain-containing protein [Prevotella sp. 10(H)]|uniref:leucine-rich repeat domain-containing protein n=1 Tax=Prevotella sp. 10(H) TaxID=1158294 RepID=UPI0004A7284F|nr:leucine-rich repeat domain-containing protein [Prevotella sp. 10(H)]
MRKVKKITIILAGILTFVLILFIILWNVNNSYDKREIEQIENFLSQQSIDISKTNGQALGYCKNWPLFWESILTIKRDNVRKAKSIGFFDGNGYKSYRLKGSLCLNDFSYLKTINISEQVIDSFKIKNCPKLERVLCYKNNLRFIEFENCPNLEDLHMNNNPIETLDLTGCSGLKVLDIKDCPLKKLIVLDTQPWRTWSVDSSIVILKNSKEVDL